MSQHPCYDAALRHLRTELRPYYDRGKIDLFTTNLNLLKVDYQSEPDSCVLYEFVMLPDYEEQRDMLYLCSVHRQQIPLERALLVL